MGFCKLTVVYLAFSSVVKNDFSVYDIALIVLSEVSYLIIQIDRIIETHVYRYPLPASIITAYHFLGL